MAQKAPAQKAAEPAAAVKVELGPIVMISEEEFTKNKLLPKFEIIKATLAKDVAVMDKVQTKNLMVTAIDRGDIADAVFVSFYEQFDKALAPISLSNA
jgi:hypothetical protein